LEVNIFCISCNKKFPPFYDLPAKSIHCPDCGSKDIKINGKSEVNIFCISCNKKFPPFYDLPAKSIHCPDCGNEDIKINSKEPSAVAKDTKEKIAIGAQPPHNDRSPISRFREPSHGRKSPSAEYSKRRQSEGMDAEKEKNNDRINPLGIDYSSDDKSRNDASTEVWNKLVRSPILLTIAVIIFSVFIFFYYSHAQHNQPAMTPPEQNPKTSKNQSPVAISRSVASFMNEPINITLTGRDPNISDNLTGSIVSNPSYGSLSEINQVTGSVVYTPNPGFIGKDEFSFKVNDGKTDSTNTGIISITVMESHNGSSTSPSVKVANNTSSDFSKYENTNAGIKIEYPSGSEGRPGYPFESLVAEFFNIISGDKDGTVKVYVDDATTMDLQNYLQDRISVYSHLNNFKIIRSSANKTLLGLPAYILTYNYTPDFTNTTYKALEVGTLFADKSYYIHYENNLTQFETSLPVVEHMINSFQLKKSF